MGSQLIRPVGFPLLISPDRAHWPRYITAQELHHRAEVLGGGEGTAWHLSGMLGHTHIFVAEPQLRPPWPLMAVSGET